MAPTIGAEIQLPFGGTKSTGNGHREAGTAAIDFYSEWKTLYIDFSDRLQRAQIDSPDSGAEANRGLKRKSLKFVSSTLSNARAI